MVDSTAVECPFHDKLTLDRTTQTWGIGRVCIGCGMPVTVTVRHLVETKPESYSGPDPGVECAYPPCHVRLRKADFTFADNRQWCTKEHREATLSGT